MLYESDSSVQEEEEDEEDDNELLGDQPSTSRHGNRPRSQEIFSIQIPNGDLECTNTQERAPKVHRYSQLETTDDNRGPDGSSSFITSLSLGNLHKARTFLSKQKLCKFSKSDTQCHYIKKNAIQGTKIIINRTQDTNYDSDEALDSDDDVTLTTRGQGHGGRNPKRGSYEPGGSSLFSAWSTYSGFLFEHNGVSWDCCVAFVVQTCMSEQCQAYTKFLKMVAWFTIFLLVLMCFRPLFYHTTFQQTRQHIQVENIDRVQHFDTPSLMDVIHRKAINGAN